ncbi:hypothetical protein ACFPRL_21125 [Pseudoclavibacter helvolus]
MPAGEVREHDGRLSSGWSSAVWVSESSVWPDAPGSVPWAAWAARTVGAARASA